MPGFDLLALLRETLKNWPKDREVDLASGGLAIVGCPPDRVSRELFLPGTAPQDCPEHHGGVVGLIDKFGRWLGSH